MEAGRIVAEQSAYFLGERQNAAVAADTAVVVPVLLLEMVVVAT